MRWYKIGALIFRDFVIFTRSQWRLIEFFYFPVTTVIIWGFFALFAGEVAREAGLMILLVSVFWSYSYICQSTVNLQMNEDIWSGSLKQVLSSGISEFEYIIARIISSSLISAVVMVLMLFVAHFFGFSIKGKFVQVLILTCLTLLASISLSVIISAFIVFLGRDYAFLSWTILQLFVLLSAPFYSADLLPLPLKFFALIMPFTDIFAAVRELALGRVAESFLLQRAVVVIGTYLIFSFPLYSFAFKRARKKGSLVKIT